jgi:hypothetical protein
MLQPHAGNYDAGDYMTNVLQQRLLMAELKLFINNKAIYYREFINWTNVVI